MSSNLQDTINLHASGKLLLAKKKYEEMLAKTTVTADNK